MIEEWKPVADYEGIYEVSNLGNIRSCDRTVAHSTEGCFRRVRGTILRQATSICGYNFVNLSKFGKRSNRLVHRLVAQAFCDGYGDTLDVNHIDGDKSNNLASNLEWVTRQENIRHSYDSGLQIAKKGSENVLAKRYVITLPDGTTKSVHGLADFCRGSGFPRREFYRILGGQRQDWKGYSIRLVEENCDEVI